MRIRFAPVLLIAATALAACSGSGSNSAMNPVAFTSFSAVQNGQPVKANGISQTVNATNTAFQIVTSTTINPVDTVSSNAQFTYGPIPAMNAFSFSAPTSNVGWMGTGVTCVLGSGMCRGASGNTTGVIMNPLDLPAPAFAWNYQTFGYWLVLGSSSSLVGTMSAGSPAPPGAIPLTGTVIYNGLSGGIYVNPAGSVFEHAATMQSTVVFDTKTITFTTTTTGVTPLGGGVVPNPASLDLRGEFHYVPGSNQFTGTVKAPGALGTITVPLLSGSATGQFYGPTAQELGGVYSLKAVAGPETMVGSFGGKR